MLLSIITITYNAEQFLERTIQSILAQTDQDFEYIIVDGKSKDGTLRIASAYKNRVNQLISEPDKGLYDAMNKGLKLATGDFVWFMNAGDEINDKETVSRIANVARESLPVNDVAQESLPVNDVARESLPVNDVARESLPVNNVARESLPVPDVLYGDTYFVNNEGEIQGLRSEITPHRLPKNLKWQDMKLGMLVCHQSFIARKSIAPLYMENNLSADIDWEIECLKRASKVQYLDFVVARYLTGGVSNQQLKRSLLDRYEVLKKHFGITGAVVAHGQILWRGINLMVRNRGKYW